MNIGLQTLTRLFQYKSLLGLFFFLSISHAAETGGGVKMTTAEPTLQRILQTQKIRLGVRQTLKPYSFMENGKPTGYVVEICQHVVERLQQKKKLPKLDVEYVPIELTNRFEKIKKGEIDLACDAVNINQKVANEVAPSYIVHLSGVRILVPEKSAIMHFGDLREKKVAVCKECSHRTKLEQLDKNFVLHLKQVPMKDSLDAYKEVEAGRVDAAAVGHGSASAALRGQSKERPLRFLDGFLSVEEIAIGLPPGEPEFKKLFNQELASFMVEGEIKKVFLNWFDSKDMNAYMREIFSYPSGFVQAVR